MICPFCEAHKPCLADESQVCCGLCARALEAAVPWAAGASTAPACGLEVAALEAGATHTGAAGNPHR